MRNIVEHGQISGSSETIVLSGVSSSRRLTRWISVPTPMTEPAGACCTARMMKSVEPTWSASSHTSWRALRVHDDDAVGVLGAEGGDVLRPEALVDRAVALPEQEGGVLEVGLASGHPCPGGGPRRACRRASSPWPGRCCGRGAGRGRTGPCRRRRRPRPGAGTPTRARRGRWSTCRPRRRGGRRRPSARPTSSCR